MDEHTTGPEVRASQQTGAGVLRRKIELSTTLSQGPETGARAWRIAIARAARDQVGVLLDTVTLRDDRLSLVELLELPPERALCAVLEGPQNGLGLLVMSPEFLASVIEMQTIGEVVSAPPLPRRPTRTDAAMSVRIIDHALTELEQGLACSPDLTWAGGFRYASFLEDPRPLGLLLEDVPYRVLRLELDIADGRRRGQVLLALPAEGRGPRPASLPRSRVEASQVAREWSLALSEAVSEAEAVLDAQVGRIRVALAQAMALEVGMILPLGRARIDQVSLVGSEGKVVGQGRLGQHRGMRALRVTEQGNGQAEAGARPVAAGLNPAAGPPVATAEAPRAEAPRTEAPRAAEASFGQEGGALARVG